MRTPPKLAQRLLQWFIKDELLEEVLGDLEEKFELEMQVNSASKARRNYWYQVIKYIRPFAITRTKYTNHTMLIRNYVKVAFRVLKKEKSFTSINVTGLTMGILCGLFIYLWVQDELSYNKFLSDGQRVCYVLNRETLSNGESNTYSSTSYFLKDILKNEYPLVESAAVLSQGNWMAFLSGEELLMEWAGVDASPEFFDLFEVSFIQGNADEMHSDIQSLVVSESMASTFFGEDWQSKNVIGSLLQSDQKEVFKLVGVYKDFPDHSTIRYDFVVPFKNLLKRRKSLNSWYNNSCKVYVKLQEGVTLSTADEVLEQAINDHREGDFVSKRDVFLQPFDEIYLHNRYENGTITGGRIEYVRLLSVAAILVVVLASINFMNMTTAQATRRSKETGVRKVLGALKNSLKLQFLTESVIIVCLAVMLAVLLMVLIMPQFNELTGKSVGLSDISWTEIALLPCIILAIGLLSGVYPAFFLSSMETIRSLKGLQLLPKKHAFMSKSLLVFQFSITTIMIIGAVTVYRQVSFILDKNIGLDRSNLIRAFNYDMDPNKDYERFKLDLLAKPGVENVTLVNQLVLDLGNSTSKVSWDGKLSTDDLEFYLLDANPDFIPTTRIRLKEGRNFSWDIQSDAENYVINETARKLMGMEDPIGQNLSIWGRKGKIIGVIEDFHNASLHSAIEPMIIRNDMSYSWMILVRAKEGMNQEAVTSLEETFQKFNPKRSFWHKFVEDIYSSQYQSERMVSDISWCFMLVSIVISLLGLFALVAYSAERRRKEVGIRKVLGASISDIMKLLSSEYMLLLAVSMALAFPVAYLVMSDWLNGFVYHISLVWWLFVCAGAVTFLLAIGIIGLKISRLANANPIGYLRDE
ncbi:MAG: hypothetical protein CMP48_04985 [Rickettsiales bacterium]|nr:hypothetical protein [Rickettsiales bacterium]